MGNIWDEILSSETEARPGAQVGDTMDKNHSELDETEVTGLSLTEFKKRSLGIQIYSEILGCEVWFCSNDSMVEQIRRDDPQAVTYTADELQELIAKTPNPAQLRTIHMAKSTFKKAKVLKTDD